MCERERTLTRSSQVSSEGNITIGSPPSLISIEFCGRNLATTVHSAGTSQPAIPAAPPPFSASAPASSRGFHPARTLDGVVASRPTSGPITVPPAHQLRFPSSHIYPSPGPSDDLRHDYSRLLRLNPIRGYMFQLPHSSLCLSLSLLLVVSLSPSGSGIDKIGVRMLHRRRGGGRACGVSLFCTVVVVVRASRLVSP